MITDVQCLAGRELKFLSEVHGHVAVGNDSVDEAVPVDENTIVGARLSRVRLDLVVNYPREVSEVDRSVNKENRSSPFGSVRRAYRSDS